MLRRFSLRCRRHYAADVIFMPSLLRFRRAIAADAARFAAFL